MVKKTLSVLLLVSFTFAADLEDDLASGRDKLTSIMSNDETGISAYNKKNIHYVESSNIEKDLNISEIAKFFDCKTLIGRSFITETLKVPVSPEDKDTILVSRQNAIRTLVENPALKKDVEELLEVAKEAEQVVIELISDFYIGKSCPELKVLEQVKEQNPVLYPMIKFLTMNPTGRNIGLFANVSALAGCSLTTCLSFRLAFLFAKHGGSYARLVASGAYSALLSGITAYTLGKDYIVASDKRSKVHSLNQLITIAEKFDGLCRDCDINHQFGISDIKNPVGVDLIQGLKHKRYQSKRTIFFRIPSVHVFLYKIHQEQKHLAEVFASIAEMDAYNAIATKIVASRRDGNQFCFVDFVDSEKSVIQSEGFWNVLVDNAVPNSICEDRHVILTGPNAGGKTTTIRSILQNIVLGQSFGVAAARSFEFTMFDVIHSYLNISDDLVNGLSLFASEVKRAQEILERIKTLPTGKKFFFALDELFTGTAAEAGEECAYRFVEKIAAFDGVQFIYATHFDRLKILGEESPRCLNYKVDVPTKDIDGKLIFPFTLSQGANKVNVAIEIAKEAALFA